MVFGDNMLLLHHEYASLLSPKTEENGMLPIKYGFEEQHVTLNNERVQFT